MSWSLLAGLWAPAHAIITRDDVPDADYVVDDAEYPAVVDLFQPGDCTGTLIHPSFLLTAAHCAEDLRAGGTLTVDGADHVVAEVILHPDWRNWTSDIALIRFEVPVEGVAPHELYRDTAELGQTMTIVGRGLHATGLEGEAGATMDRQLRRATNIVTATTTHWIEVTFDAPGDVEITDLEGVGAAGDSGGPAFIETGDGILLAGLNSWGDAMPYRDIGKYGAWDYSTRVSTYADWIDEVVDTSSTPGTSTDPTPTGTTGTSGTQDDAAAPDPRTEDSGGCGCSVPNPAPTGAGALFLTTLLVQWRRRNS